MGAPILLAVVVAAAPVFDVLAIDFGQDSQSLADNEWTRPCSSGAATGREC